MAVFQPKYKDLKTGETKTSSTWWFSFYFAGRRYREPTKATSKTVAKLAEQQKRRELESGYNAVPAEKKERVRTLNEVSDDYLAQYRLKHRSILFAEHAVGHVVRHLGSLMSVEVSERTVTDYQAKRLKEKAAPKTINEEVGFLLRLLGDQGDLLRNRLRRTKNLKLKVPGTPGRAFSQAEQELMLEGARAARSPFIYPALALALNTGMRAAEIRNLTWAQVDLEARILTVGRSKTAAGEGRTIPLNSQVLSALAEHATWYTKTFHETRPDWYLFPARIGRPSKGAKRPMDPTKPVTTLKTAWRNVRDEAGIKGRWHDTRHTLITELCESGAGDQTVMDIAGHVSRQMLARPKFQALK